MKSILLILALLIITSSYGKVKSSFNILALIYCLLLPIIYERFFTIFKGGVVVSQLSLDLLEDNYYSEGYESRIIGGSEAEIGEFPYIVSLQRVAENGVDQSHFCAGSIYDEYTIITSAECGFV